MGYSPQGHKELDTTERLHFFFNYHRLSKKPGTSWVAQLVKNPPAIQETLVQFLGQEDLLETG